MKLFWHEEEVSTRDERMQAPKPFEKRWRGEKSPVSRQPQCVSGPATAAALPEK